MTALGFGDISAVTNLERTVTTLCMAAGATYYAYLVVGRAQLYYRLCALSRILIVMRVFSHNSLVAQLQFYNTHELERRLVSNCYKFELRMVSKGALFN